MKKRPPETRFFFTETGFTLIELLIAMALLSIVLAAVYSTFFLSSRALTGLDDSLLTLRECRTALDRIAREIDSAVYTDKNKRSLFRLEDRDLYGKQTSRVTFTSWYPLSPGLSILSYSVEEKEGGLVLTKNVRSAHRPVEDNRGADVIEKLEAFTVEVKNGDSWVKTWDTAETKKAPAEVRITITVRVKDRPVTVYEIVRPKTGNSI